MNARTATAVRSRVLRARAFSIIEVLISVLVLGIGLLGLAAVFPVVISQQRDASDVILGGVASEAIRSQIRASTDIAAELLSQDGVVDASERNLDGDLVPNEDENDDRPNDGDGDGVPDDFDDGYVVGSEEPIFGTGEDIQNNPQFNQRTGYSYLWEGDWAWGDGALGPNARIPERYRIDYINDGGMRYRDPREREIAGVPESAPDLPVGSRLYPRPFSIPGEPFDGPRYVWDFVPRRAPGNQIEMAVFVRRIDPGIRVPSGTTLSRLLTSTPGAPDALHPVGMDEDGLPTRDGGGDYAIPLTARALPVPSADYRDSPEWNATPQIDALLDGIRIDVSQGDEPDVTTASARQIALLAEVGQRFVDNLGVVREVVEVLDVDGETVDLRVRPPLGLAPVLPSFDALAALNEEQISEPARAGKLRQIVFTTQPPVDVFVMEFSTR